MTKTQLEAVVDELVSIIDTQNDAAADEDRGRANDGIHLSLFDDGSGCMGMRRWGYKREDQEKATLEVEDWHEFKDLDGLVELLKRQGTEFVEPADTVKACRKLCEDIVRFWGSDRAWGDHASLTSAAGEFGPIADQARKILEGGE